MSGPRLYLGNPHQSALSQEQQQSMQPEEDPMMDMGSDLAMDAILPGLGSVMSVSREVHGDGQRLDPLMDPMTGKPVSRVVQPDTAPKPAVPDPSSEKPKVKGPSRDAGPTFDPMG